MIIYSNAYLVVWVDFGLDLFAYNKLSNFVFNLLNVEVESLCDFSHIDDFVGSNVLNQGLLSDLAHNVVNLVAEEDVELQCIGYMSEAVLEFHVSSIQEILYDIWCLWRHLNKIFEVRGTNDVLLEFLSIHTHKRSQSHVKSQVLRSAVATENLGITYTDLR